MNDQVHQENRRLQSEGKSPMSETEAKAYCDKLAMDANTVANFPAETRDEPSENPDLLAAEKAVKTKENATND